MVASWRAMRLTIPTRDFTRQRRNEGAKLREMRNGGGDDTTLGDEEGKQVGVVHRPQRLLSVSDAPPLLK